MPATRCRAVWRVPISRPWLESLSSGLASWWSSIFAPPIARLARLRLAPLAIGDDAHHFVNNVRSNPNFSSLSFQRQLNPAIQNTEPSSRLHQDLPLTAPSLLGNSLADDGFCPPTSLGVRYAPATGVFPIAEFDASVDVCFYVLASLFEGRFRDIVAQLSRFYGGSRSDRTMRQRAHRRLDFVSQKTVIPEARILDD